MMDDLISRQAAIDEIKAVYEWHDMPTEERMIQHFKALPSAERKGTWIYHTEPLAFRPYGHYTCNLCNEISWDKSNFCPNCGAEMRGEQDG